jgi:hypothetical protein
MGQLGIPELLIILIIAALFIIFPWWRIFKRSGNFPALSLLMLVPLVNLGLFLWFAFAEWPIEKQLKALGNQRSVQ